MKIRSNPFLNSIAVLSVAIITTGTTYAANRYWDTDVLASLQPGSGTWDEATTALWSSATAGSNPLVVFNSADDAFFQTAGANAVTLASAVTARSVTQTTNGTATTISGAGTLTISIGNITNSGNTAFNLNPSGLVLGATGTISASNAINIGAAISGASGIGFIKTGSATLTLSGDNSFTGPMTVNNGLVATTRVTSGTPFGTGSINLNGAGGALNFGSGAVGLSIVPNDLLTTALTGGTQSGSQLSFANTAGINLTPFDISFPLTFTYGSGSGSVLNRVDKGVLVFMDNISATPGNMGIDGGNNFIVSGTAPTVTNGMVPAFYIGARNGGSGDSTFMTYDGTFGFKPADYDVTDSLSEWDNTKKVTISSDTVTTDSAAYALRTTGAINIDPGVTVSIGNGGSTPAGLIAYDSISGGTLAFGASEGLVFVAGTASNPVVISSSITGSGGLTKSQYLGTNGQLTLTGSNSYSGTTTINTGLLNVGNGGTTGDLGNSTQVVLGAGATISFNRSDALLSYAINITGLGNVTTNGPGTLSLSGNNNFGQLNFNSTNLALNTAIVLINGGTTNVANIVSGPALGTQTLQVSAGTLNVTGGGRGIKTKLTVDGGIMNLSGERLSFNGSAGQTLTVSAGQLNSNTHAVFLGNNVGNSPNQTGNVNFTGTQTGGTFKVLNSFNMGGSAGSTAVAFNLSGGTLDVRGTNDTNGAVLLGADTAATGSTTLTLSGTGKLISRFNPASGNGISGSQASAVQVLALNGGTLAAGRITATNLRGSAGGTNGTIVNNGANIAPGDLGSSGKTAIVGSFTQSSGTLSFDLGGTTASTVWQDVASSAKHDQVTATATVALGGALNVSLIDSFVPANTDTFTILTGASVSGTFSNVSGGKVTLTGGATFDVAVNATNVVLSNYTAPGGNTFASWIGGFSVGGQTGANDDFDNDDLDNAVENVLGSNPSVSNTGLTQVSATAGSFKFRHNQSNTIATDVTKSYQWSTDLVEWKASGQTNTGGTTATIGEATITDAIAPLNDVIEVTVTVTGGPATKVFGRLVATKAP